MEKSTTPTTSHRVGYAFAIFFLVVFLIIVNNLLNWHLPFISQVLTQDFEKCLWAINLSLAATIFGNFVFMFYDPKWFRHMMQVIFGGFSLISTFVFFSIFPLNLPSPLFEQLVRWALIIAIAATAISIIVELVQAIRNYSLASSEK